VDAWAILFYSGFGCLILILSNSYIDSDMVSTRVFLLDNLLVKFVLLDLLQSALLIWVGDHNHGLLIYIFGNLCTSIY
jgi:hypothetical protein